MLKILRWRKAGERTVILGYSGGLSVITRMLTRRRGRHEQQNKKNDTMIEAEIRLSHSKDRRNSHEPRNTGRLWKVLKGRKKIFSWSLKKRFFPGA